MGATYVDVTVRNPADLDRSWTGSFLVDTGAFDSMAPSSVLEAIGLEPVSSREYELADGSIVTYGIGVAVLEFEGVLMLAISEIPQSRSSKFPTLGVLLILVPRSFRSVFAGLGLVGA